MRGKKGICDAGSPRSNKLAFDKPQPSFDLAQCPAATFGDFELMTTKIDEYSRLKARIVDLERGLAQAREKNVGAGSRFLGDAEQDQMLQMLVRTLKALKARQAVLSIC